MIRITGQVEFQVTIQPFVQAKTLIKIEKIKLGAGVLCLKIFEFPIDFISYITFNVRVVLMRFRERLSVIIFCPCPENGYYLLNIFSSPHIPNIVISRSKCATF